MQMWVQDHGFTSMKNDVHMEFQLSLLLLYVTQKRENVLIEIVRGYRNV